jgi:adenosylmethionine-8-amino-7-oxononanoate aminotransferase
MLRENAAYRAAHLLHLPFGQAYPACDLTCARALERLITAYGPESIAAFIVEPVSGAALGATVPPPTTSRPSAPSATNTASC